MSTLCVGLGVGSRVGFGVGPCLLYVWLRVGSSVGLGDGSSVGLGVGSDVWLGHAWCVCLPHVLGLGMLVFVSKRLDPNCPGSTRWLRACCFCIQKPCSVGYKCTVLGVGLTVGLGVGSCFVYVYLMCWSWCWFKCWVWGWVMFAVGLPYV